MHVLRACQIISSVAHRDSALKCPDRIKRSGPMRQLRDTKAKRSGDGLDSPLACGSNGALPLCARQH